MLGDDYKKALSFPVPQELLQKTAQKMRMASEKAGIWGRGSIRLLWKRGLVTAAALCLVVLSVVAYERLNGSRDGKVPLSGQASAPLLGSGREDEAQYSAGAQNPGNYGVAAAQRSAQNANRSADLPKITLELAKAGGSDNAVVLAHRADEVLDSANPWTVETSGEISSLPVFRNTCRLNADGLPEDGATALPYDQLEALAQAAASETGLTLLPHSEEDDSYSGDGRFVSYGAQTQEGYGIQVLQNGDVVFSENPRQAADHALISLSFDDLRTQIWNQYQPLFGRFGLKNPVLNFSSDYSFDGERHTNISVYDQSGTLSEQIVNFQKAVPLAAWTEDGAYVTETAPAVKLYRQKDLWETEIGNYPIRTLEEAGAALQEGSYVTAASSECEINGDTVENVELVYYGNAHTEFMQPVYSFYVKLDSEPAGSSADAPDGLNAYGMYLVAAVKPEYLEQPAD